MKNFFGWLLTLTVPLLALLGVAANLVGLI